MGIPLNMRAQHDIAGIGHAMQTDQIPDDRHDYDDFEVPALRLSNTPAASLSRSHAMAGARSY
jgi:hypothetical protein